MPLDVDQALALAAALVDTGADLDRVEKFDAQAWRVSVHNPDDTFDVYYEEPT